MKYLLILLFLSLSLALYAAEDHCTYNFADAKSIFDQNPKLYQNITPVNKDQKNKILTQTITTPKGTVITYKKGGCAHYAFSFLIRPRKLNAKKPERIFIQALRELRAIPAVDKTEINILNEALDRTKWKSIKFENGQYNLSCGDATCALKTIKVKGVESDIEISYDFAL
ncbi:hypothetical protein DOM21_15755 [Bacteriovorax stolpii]|uniref:Uncharacterized protein n=1 Tax=Bacteriovorax stolpii TaxID=960 RepID=A0A2K9NNW6_BACTC|nr:hypothetical protein [Bacteriovorax stolpii]AUN97182.1 hypothetical protein C0V70_03470 [Bacteriovorax stolpii]QDK42879.1 hypothetical protein DOM21_15755 [Bacteriovorax stolpii]TDP53469.1 hypothetical protein C8D79_2113 [Bacteriovorax stolpii]